MLNYDHTHLFTYLHLFSLLIFVLTLSEKKLYGQNYIVSSSFINFIGRHDTLGKMNTSSSLHATGIIWTNRGSFKNHLLKHTYQVFLFLLGSGLNILFLLGSGLK